MITKVDNYTATRTLGKGFSARVKLATDEEGNQCALKIFYLHQMKEEKLALMRHEVEVTRDLEHKHVAKQINFSKNSHLVKSSGKEQYVAYIAQEAALGGSLYDYTKMTGPLPESICRYYFL